MPKPLKNPKAEKERMVRLKHKMNQRITIVRYGKESQDTGDYANSIRKYVDYLLTMAEVKNVSGIYSLRVSHFVQPKDLTEMLMISHLYFELARMYDAVPKFHEESQKCLEQFVHFSANQPYQVVNSELVRKYLKKAQFKNPEAFRKAYHQIYVQSKKCFVVTYCYGDQHPVTQDYRKFKDWLLDYSLGQRLVGYYYQHSSHFINKWGSNRLVHILFRFVISPILLLFSKTLLRVIISK